MPNQIAERVKLAQDKQRQSEAKHHWDNKAFLFCLQNMSVIKQLSSLLVE